MDPFRDNTGYGRYGEGGAEIESVHSLGTDAMRPEMTQLRGSGKFLFSLCAMGAEKDFCHLHVGSHRACCAYGIR
jgi:hypothetical protein